MASIFNIKNPQEIIDQVRAVTQNWKDYAKEYGVGKSSMQMIEKIINK